MASKLWISCWDIPFIIQPPPLWMRSIRIPPVGIFFQRHRQKSEGVGKVFSKGSDKNPTSRNLIIHRGGSDYKWNVPLHCMGFYNGDPKTLTPGSWTPLRSGSTDCLTDRSTDYRYGPLIRTTLARQRNENKEKLKI